MDYFFSEGVAIRRLDPYDHRELRKQLEEQRRLAWDIESGIEWAQGIDLNRFFLPLDDDSIAFPGASAEQRLALSQFMGLVVNSTIAEMETVAFRIRDVAWRAILDGFPVNPEMIALGDQFFTEEIKHAQMFARYVQHFAEEVGVDVHELDSILPKAYGSTFQTAILRNAQRGGHAFWWVVALVEEEAVLLYQQMYRHRKVLDPLFYQIHKRHFEEESRHTNYAFMMLKLIRDRQENWRQQLHRRVDRIYSELFTTTWVLAELHKVFNVPTLAHRHPFFSTLASCIPLMKELSWRELASRLFVSAPYVSSVLNPRYHRLTSAAAAEHGALGFHYPEPNPAVTFASAEDIWISA